MGIDEQNRLERENRWSRQKKWFFWGIITLIIVANLYNRFGAKEDAITYNTLPLETVSLDNLVRLPPSTVAIVQGKKEKAEDLTYEDIRSMVAKAVDLAGGFTERIKDGDTVVLKPNLVQNFDFTEPGWRGKLLETEVNGVTTDWRVVKAVVELVRAVNPSGEVYVMEGSSGATSKANMRYFKYTSEYIPGVTEFIGIEEDSGGWHEYDSPRLVQVHLEEGLLHKEYYLNRRYKEADFLISIPTLKNHWSGGVSGGIKNVGIGATPANIYGISPYNHGRNNMVVHDSRSGELHKWIHDYFLCRPVDFVVMDGLQGIQNGPTPCYEMSQTSDIRDDQMNMRLILAGSDAVAVDTVESLLMCWDPLSIGHLVMLNQSGAGNLDTSRINVVGENVSAVRKDFAGVKPIPGGEKFTDLTGPQLQVDLAELTDSGLDLSLTTEEDTSKVEIYLDNVLIDVVTADYSRITLETEVAKERAEVKVIAYDRFLNHTEVANIVSVQENSRYYKAPQAAGLPQIDGKGEEECWAVPPGRPLTSSGWESDRSHRISPAVTR